MTASIPAQLGARTPTGSDPTAASSAALPVRGMVTASSGDGHESEDRGDDGVRSDALHLGFGAELDAVTEGGQGEGFHVVGDDVVPAGEPGPRTGGGQQRGGATGGDTESE